LDRSQQSGVFKFIIITLVPLGSTVYLPALEWSNFRRIRIASRALRVHILGASSPG